MGRNDALGRRIEKRSENGTGTTKTRFIHDGVRVAEEWDIPATGSPTLEASYVYGNYVDEVLTMRRGGVDYYYHGDDMHNVVKLTDGDGLVVEGYDYGDYGAPEFFDANGAQTSATASTVGNPYLFSGREWEEELGLYHFRNRYMDPALGRFTSRDPLGLRGDAANLGNGYTYAASNPWSMVDPFGFESGGNATEEAYDEFFRIVRDLALGATDWGVDGVDFAIHHWRMGVDPFYAYRVKNEQIQVGLAVMQDPAAAVEALQSTVIGYFQNFDWRDAGYLLPELVATFFTGGGKSAATSGGKLGARILNKLKAGVPKVPRISVRGLVDSVKKWWQGRQCFVAGTLVLTSGGLVPIEDVQAGTLVAARSDVTGEVAWKEVVQLYANVDRVILHVTVTGEDGESEIIGTTLTHPFRVADGPWVQAGNLAVGDQIASHDDGILTVTKRRAAKELHDTFNFEVEDFHTYFVGEVGAWVHNTCPPTYSERIRQRAVEDPGGHNFPFGFDESILSTTPTPLNNNGLGYALRGFKNGQEYVFNMIVRDGVVVHRDMVHVDKWAQRSRSFEWPVALEDIPK